MKINSSTDIFYQDTCGNATFHLPCSPSEGQGHWLKWLQESDPHAAPAANRKVNEIGTEIEQEPGGCNRYCMGAAPGPACLNVK